MREYTYAEIKQSRIISEKKAPRFGMIIITITLVFLIGLLTASAFITKPYVVTFEGEITGNNVTNITNKVSGSITSINVENGDSVEVGDLLYTIDPTNVVSQIEQLNETLKIVNLKIDTTLLLIKYINNYDLLISETLLNPFNKDDLNEQKEYNFASEFNTYVINESLTQIEIEEIKPTYLVSHNATYDEYFIKKTETQSTIDFLTNTLDDYEVRATSHGLVYLNNEINVGTVVALGTTLGTLENGNIADFYIETLVDVASKNKLKIDDKVTITISGLNSKDFGTLDGTITEITEDTIVIDGILYYYVKVKPVTTSLKDKDDNVVFITCGMKASCVVTYDEATWLEWAMSQLGVEFK